MQLTRYTDYAMRVLIHVGAEEADRLSSIQEIADTFGISKDHLKKVVHNLGQAGLLETVRGRGGGLRLGRPPNQISIGQIVRQTETGFDLVDCSTCLIAPACTLPRVLNEATRAFLDVLDRYTLADILTKQDDFRALFARMTPMMNAISDQAEGKDACPRTAPTKAT